MGAQLCRSLRPPWFHTGLALEAPLQSGRWLFSYILFFAQRRLLCEAGMSLNHGVFGRFSDSQS